MLKGEDVGEEAWQGSSCIIEMREEDDILSTNVRMFVLPPVEFWGAAIGW